MPEPATIVVLAEPMFRIPIISRFIYKAAAISDFFTDLQKVSFVGVLAAVATDSAPEDMLDPPTIDPHCNYG